eukprot:jgi/Mesvir1/18986/Mv18947-RA.1
MATGTTVELEISSDDAQVAAILELVRAGKIELPPEFGDFEIYVDGEEGDEGEGGTGEARLGYLEMDTRGVREDVMLAKPPSPTGSQASESRHRRTSESSMAGSGGGYQRKCLCCQMLQDTRVAGTHTFAPFPESDNMRRMSIDSSFVSKKIWRPAGKVAKPLH